MLIPALSATMGFGRVDKTSTASPAESADFTSTDKDFISAAQDSNRSIGNNLASTRSGQSFNPMAHGTGRSAA